MTPYFTFLFILFIFLSEQLIAITPAQLAKLKPSYCSKYIPESASGEEKLLFLELPVDFNNAEISKKTEAKLLNGRSIKKITLYFTVYRLAETFDQPALNLERFKKLYALIPSAFRNSFVEWQVKGQTACVDADDAKTFFHGFVIEYLAAPSAESILAEKISIDKFSKNDSLGKDTVYYTETYRTRKRTKWSGFFLPRSERKRRAHIVYKEKSLWKRDKEYVTVVDSVKFTRRVKYFKPSVYAMKFIYHHVVDTTILAVLNRNQSWKNMVFVVDITGSMAPYTNQLFVWYKLNALKRSVKNFTFFNDGDAKPQYKKIVGKTGGIYFSDGASPSDVIEIGMSSMMKGSGGDAPENNCEAILSSLNMNSDAKEIFMIADNWANMRDTSLISKIHKPVHVILCGASGNLFNTQYLDLARRTNGSVHTLDKDIDDLMRMTEGEKIKIGETFYIIRRGKFEILRQS